jgi:hypothetical protein
MFIILIVLFCFYCVCINFCPHKCENRAREVGLTKWQTMCGNKKSPSAILGQKGVDFLLPLFNSFLQPMPPMGGESHQDATLK